jgi:RND family efflux transporter MFP subunit
VALGIIALIVLVKTRSGPEQTPLAERVQSVRIIRVPVVDVIPRVVGYGNVAPGVVWEAVADVNGRIVDKHPELRRGNILPAGTVLLRIDPTEYELAIAQIEADITSTHAQLAELDIKQANTRELLQIQTEALLLAQQELRRKRKLMEQKTISRSDYEREQRNYLAQKEAVRTLQNTLELLPTERRLLEAQLGRDQARLDSARLDLAHTLVTLPFDARISEVSVEHAQFVRQGESLATADGVHLAEVSTQIPIARFKTLLQADQTLDLIGPGAASFGTQLGLTAKIWLRGAHFKVSWDARLARLSDSIDPKTRTVGVIVEVDEPYANVKPGIRPPLVKGMFVDVELRGEPRPKSLIVPRTALYGDQVYRLTVHDRLEKRRIQVGLVAPTYVIVTSGLQAGDTIVVSDLVPAIDGMALKPIPDDQFLQRLVRSARAEEHPP